MGCGGCGFKYSSSAALSRPKLGKKKGPKVKGTSQGVVKSARRLKQEAEAKLEETKTDETDQ